MLRAPLALPTVLIAGSVLAGTAQAREGHAGALSDAVLPGGLRSALAAIRDPVSPDRAQFLLEFIRRTYDAPIRSRADTRNAALDALLTQIADARRAGTSPADTLPLPLTRAFWVNDVFGGRVAEDDLVPAILQSRSASLFYVGLLSLDDETRAWLSGQRALAAEILARYAAPFEIAAPALRVAGGIVLVPGGEPAHEAWEALTGREVKTPADFIRALLREREGRLAYFLGSIGQLNASRLRFVLALDRDPPDRIAAVRRLAGIFDRIAAGWNIDQHAFWRPAFDPALLAGDLPARDDGRPMLAGSEAFWQAVYAGEPVRTPETAAALVRGDTADFTWVCEQIFEGDPVRLRVRYQQVLYASRLVPALTPENAADALAAVQAMASYPVLALELERAGLRDVGALAAAARRAARLSAIGNRGRATRSLSQFQGALALITRGARRGSVPRESLPGLVSSLAAVELSADGEYEGRLVGWIEHQLGAGGEGPSDEEPYQDASGPLERALLRVAAGASPVPPATVEWEGTRYRVDLALAEATRISRLLGDDRHADFSAAASLVRKALTLPPGTGSASRLRREADEQLARGLRELVYAIAFGQPDSTPILAREAAERHDFGFTSRQTDPWGLPFADSNAEHGWHMVGSLLGMDVALAHRALVRLSPKPLGRAPTLDGSDRTAFIEGVALIEPLRLTDRDRDAIVTAMREGRERVAAAGSVAEVRALANEIALGPARRTLLEWTATHDRARVPGFFSPLELLWLGHGDTGALQAWGASASGRIGCLCLQLAPPQPWESIAGRWTSGNMASMFPDLNLRIAELLAELRMPAPLAPAVLAAATVDLVDSVASRDGDDRRALVDFVRALNREQVEEYLALLTTGGPLVPIGVAR